LKVKLPPGTIVVAAPAGGVTTAVNVTDWFTDDVAGEVETVATGVALETVCVKLWTGVAGTV
jgi:hypothetical protein